MKKLLFILSCLICLEASAQTTTQKIDSLLTHYTQAGEFNGSALVARQGIVLLEKGYGFSNVDKGTLNDAGTIFQAASLTKQFTGCVILKLAELHKMELTDTLSKYYPGFPNGGRITIKNLLAHTSGIVDRPDTALVMPIIPKASREQWIVATLSLKKLAFEPGTAREYSNSGYILLGYIIEQVSGMTYFDAVDHFIFKPLHMRRSCFDLSKVATKDKATGYSVFSRDLKTPSTPIDPYGPFSAGAICSTVQDLYKWHRGLQEYRIVSKKSLEEAYTPVIRKYGYGLNIDSLYNMRVVMHSGGIPGFTSFISRIPEDDTCIVLLNNKPGNNLERIVGEIYAIIYDGGRRPKQ